MKNLVQGQEISIFKSPRGFSFLRYIDKFDPEKFPYRIINTLWIFLIVGFLYLDVSYWGILYPYETGEYNPGYLWFPFLIISGLLWVIGLILTLVFLLIFRLIFPYILKMGNPSVVYFNDCLFVSTPNYQLLQNEKISFDGEIPFGGIERFLFKEKIGKVIIRFNKKNEFYESSKFFSSEYKILVELSQKILETQDLSEDFTFNLSPDLRKIGLQIVEELNSKLKKE